MTYEWIIVIKMITSKLHCQSQNYSLFLINYIDKCVKVNKPVQYNMVVFDMALNIVYASIQKLSWCDFLTHSGVYI